MKKFQSLKKSYDTLKNLEKKMKQNFYDSADTKSKTTSSKQSIKNDFYALVKIRGKSIVSQNEIRGKCPKHFDAYSSLHVFKDGSFHCTMCDFQGTGFTLLNSLKTESYKEEIPPEVFSGDEDKAEAYLNSRGIYGMAKKYSIGADDEHIYIPIKYKDFTYYIIRRTIKEKDFKRITYDNDFPCLFGCHEDFQKTAILVESTFDKLYLSQFGFLVFSTNGLDYFANMNIFLQYKCDKVLIIPQNDEEKDGFIASNIWLRNVMRNIKGKIPHAVYRIKGHDCNEERTTKEEIEKAFHSKFTY